jgi:hypothetical protein
MMPALVTNARNLPLLEIKRYVERSARRPFLTGSARDGLERLRIGTEGWALQGLKQKDMTSDGSPRKKALTSLCSYRFSDAGHYERLIGADG